jgi:xylanolytic transcriptional activator XlnR
VRAHEACIVTLNTEYQVSAQLSYNAAKLPVWERALAAFSLNHAVSVPASFSIFRDDGDAIMLADQTLQRNFRKVMRSALQQVRGRGMDEHAEFAQLRRREMLSLYRWSGDGTGLAL